MHHFLIGMLAGSTITAVTMLYIFSITPKKWSAKKRLGTMLVGMPVGMILGQLVLILFLH